MKKKIQLKQPWGLNLLAPEAKVHRATGKEFTLEKGKRSKLLKNKIQLKQPWGLNLLAPEAKVHRATGKEFVGV